MNIEIIVCCVSDYSIPPSLPLVSAVTLIKLVPRSASFLWYLRTPNHFFFMGTPIFYAGFGKNRIFYIRDDNLKFNRVTFRRSNVEKTSRSYFLRTFGGFISERICVCRLEIYGFGHLDFDVNYEGHSKVKAIFFLKTYFHRLSYFSRYPQTTTST